MSKVAVVACIVQLVYSEQSCHDAVEGETCYADALWAKDDGIHSSPQWYPGLTPASSLADFQAHLHYCYWKRCPMPCAATTQRACSLPGRFWDASNCTDPEPGSQCDGAITWAMDYGIHSHPEWYPSLSENADRDEFQERMYQSQQSGIEEHGCPKPCCHDSLQGELCHEETTWAMLYGINLPNYTHVYPPSLTNESAFAEFQEYLHLCYPGRCPLPCKRTALSVGIKQNNWTLDCPDGQDS